MKVQRALLEGTVRHKLASYYLKIVAHGMKLLYSRLMAEAKLGHDNTQQRSVYNPNKLTSLL